MTEIRAEVIAVGTELLDLPVNETNSVYLAQKMQEVGARVYRKWIVGDRQEEIRRALQTALDDGSQIVLFSGGLGPTSDDITREVVASHLGRDLILDSEILRRLEAFFAGLGVEMPANNRRQAQVPYDATVLENPKGTAPGLLLEESGARIFLLPGPPRELKPLVESQVLPIIRGDRPHSALKRRHLKVAAVGESRLDALIEPIYRDFPDVEVSVLSSTGIVDVVLNWRGPQDSPRAGEALNRLVGLVTRRLGSSVYADRDIPLQVTVAELLRQRGKTVATAESCTGGLISKLLTDVAGSSRYFTCGFVTYSNQSKSALLGVNETSLERNGAVSESTARQMAIGARERSGADFGLSVTGIAGPDGGTADKPVGLVFIGVACEGDVQVKRFVLPGDRDAVRLRTARTALDSLRRQLL